MNLRRKITSALIIVIGLIAPFGVYRTLMMNMLCFALFACAFDLMMGCTGILSFGHAAFFGGAAYATAFVMTALHWPPALGILAGIATAALLGAVFGGLAIRSRGIYFAMITLGLAQIVYFAAVQAPFTGGENGIQGVPLGKLFGFIDLADSWVMYYVVFAIFLIGFGIIDRVIHSPFGNVLQAIRENETRTLSLGYSVARVKLLTFVLSAALSGLAGATYTLVFQFATLDGVRWTTSGDVILMDLLGGVGTAVGPILGAFGVVALRNKMAGMDAWVSVIIGGVFIVCVLAFRHGVVGTADMLVKQMRTSARRLHAVK